MSVSNLNRIFVNYACNSKSLKYQEHWITLCNKKQYEKVFKLHRVTEERLTSYDYQINNN